MRPYSFVHRHTPTYNPIPILLARTGKGCECTGAAGEQTRDVAAMLEKAGMIRYSRLESINHINHVYVRGDIAQACNASTIDTLS